MFRKELKYRIFSIVFLLISAAVLLMTFSSVVPRQWFLYAEPLDLSRYAYIELRSAYEKGTMQAYQIIRDDSERTADWKLQDGRKPEPVQVILDQEEREQVLEFLKRMNPQYTEQEKLSGVKIALGEDEVIAEVRKLEHSIGDALERLLAETEQMESCIEEQYYGVYTAERFDICTNPTEKEMLDSLEENLEYYIQEGHYPVYQWGVGLDYAPMFFGYVRHVRFTEQQRQDIWTILREMIQNREKTDGNSAINYYGQRLDEVDAMLGGHTIFAEENREIPSGRRNTLEEEQAVFAEILHKEGYANPYARYLCDYLGILAGILPVLYAAFLFSRDRKTKIEAYIMVSPQKSSQIVGKRLLSVNVVFLAWFYLTAAAATIYFAYLAGRFGYEMDVLAFFKYVTVWLVPTVCFTTALSLFLDLLLQNSLGVLLVQLLLFFVSIKDLLGSYPLWKPILRFNAIGRYSLYKAEEGRILVNRTVIFAASLLLYGGAVLLYERRRQGKQLFSVRNTAFYQRGIQVFRVGERKDRGETALNNKLHGWFYYQFRQTFSRSFFAALAFSCFVGLLFQGFGRELEQLKRIGENYLALSSVFLFIPLCNMEKEANAYEVMCVQRKAYVGIYLLRAGAACLLQLVVLAVPLVFFVLRFDYSWGPWFFGLYASALFLGLLGLLVGEKLRSRRLGIAAALGYYVLCISLESKMKWMSVCGYTYRISNSKYDLLAGCATVLLLLAGLLLYRNYAKRRIV